MTFKNSAVNSQRLRLRFTKIIITTGESIITPVIMYKVCEKYVGAYACEKPLPYFVQSLS